MRVLCLGNNTEDTDRRAQELAQQRGMPCRGLLSEISGHLSPHDYQVAGLYHTSVYDISFGRLIDLMDQFDHVIVLDQPKQEWSHPDAYLMTLRAADSTTSSVEYRDKSSKQSLEFFQNLVQSNKSFCIFPFIELLAYGEHSTVCCRSTKPVAHIQNISDWRANAAYQEIRHKMIEGEQIWEYCASCYNLERKGVISARQQETVEWANRLDLTSVDDLERISTPAYVEIRASNKCNLQCRTCIPELSHRIDREYQTIGLRTGAPIRTFDHGFDLVDFTNLRKLYVAGGEPLVMPEFYAFLDRCIDQGQTNLELLINTNGTKLSDRFKQQIKHFGNLQFIFSIDALGTLNHYIRWPSNWHTIINNLSYLHHNNHTCAINTTVSIYNVARLWELFDFLDNRFPNILIHIELAESPAPTSLWLYPDRSRVIDDLKKVRHLPCYSNSALFASSIDGMIEHFQKMKGQSDLQTFFDFNDKLDLSRSIALADYLPDLDQYRSK